MSPNPADKLGNEMSLRPAAARFAGVALADALRAGARRALMRCRPETKSVTVEATLFGNSATDGADVRYGKENSREILFPA